MSLALPPSLTSLARASEYEQLIIINGTKCARSAAPQVSINNCSYPNRTCWMSKLGVHLISVKPEHKCEVAMNSTGAYHNSFEGVVHHCYQHVQRYNHHTDHVDHEKN